MAVQASPKRSTVKKAGRPKGSSNRLSQDTKVVVEEMVKKHGLLSPIEIAMFSVNHAYDTVQEIIQDEHSLNSKEGQLALQTTNQLLKTVLPYVHHQLKNVVITEEDVAEDAIESAVKKLKDKILARENNKTQ